MRFSPRDANNEFFDREGVALLLDVLAFLLLLLDARTPPPEEWLGDDPFAPPRLWVESFLERARGGAGERGPNVVALAAWALAGPLVAVCPNPSESCLFGDIATAALAAWEPEPGEALDLLVRACTYWPCSAAIDRQHAGVVGVARGVCDELASPAIARAIYFGVEPGYVVGADASSTVDFERLVACDAGGSPEPAILVYQPSRDGADALIAAALKAVFFEAVLDNPDRQRGGPDLPMVAYVADEAHRFVPTHGDQSFFEFSRSHAAFCVLASPSIASFEHALVQRGGTQTQNATSVSMLWVNTANKLFFRSSDVRTADRLDALCPRVPGLATLTRVRPVIEACPRVSRLLRVDQLWGGGACHGSSSGGCQCSRNNHVPSWRQLRQTCRYEGRLRPKDRIRGQQSRAITTSLILPRSGGG